MSSCSISEALRLAAKMAPSFSRLARSAPDMPGVWRAIMPRSTDGANDLSLACTLRMAARPSTSGGSTWILRSKRPGRVRALSSTSARLVAARTTTPLLASKPSISVRSWFTVCSRSSLPCPKPALRCRPTASISSMKMIDGAFFSASSNALRRLPSASPAIFDMISGPLIRKKKAPVSLATARAINVFPLPGGPYSSTPRGGFTPSVLKSVGCRSGSSIISRIWAIAFLQPPMSS
mmetsp:Transcript_20168/g.54110  ORF Transcript_20168/g.54110 Transcript_20168/m.54110 type:complete len:236 (+) Transcript_20168:1218-1925(+)